MNRTGVPIDIRGTTVLCVRRNRRVVMASDGQVTVGDVVMKHNAVKVRRAHGGKVLTGFAGATADAMTLFERFDQRLKDYSGNLARATVELAKDWRTDKALRRLDALLLVADIERTFLVSGGGDVLEPDEDAMAIGSGGSYALAAARALLRHTDLDARQVAETAMRIASELCIYTNSRIVTEELP